MDAQKSDVIMPADLSTFNIADLVKTPHNVRLYREVQTLKKLINELVDYQLAHPKIAKPTTREGIDNEKKAKLEIEKREKYIRAQLSIPGYLGHYNGALFGAVAVGRQSKSVWIASGGCDRDRVSFSMMLTSLWS